MKPPAPSARRGAASAHFRAEIERAEAGGLTRDEMKLKLTLSDVSQLKRDPTIAVEDISFSDGVMRFVGVKVQQGGVATSALVEAATDIPDPEPPAKPVKKTRGKAKPKAEA